MLAGRLMSAGERETEASQSVAQSLRQATQLLLQAAERLDPQPSPVPSVGLPRTSTNNSQSGSALRECIGSLRSSRSGSNSHSLRITNGSSSTSAQSLFQPLRHTRGLLKKRPYSGKKWQHVFVCLSQVGQFIPPDTADRVRLAQAGLGEKRISCSYDGSVDELHQELLSAFPPLRGGGGYEFLRLDEASRRQLSVVPPPPGGYNQPYLKAVFLQAKIFIRPLQKNLDLTPVAESEVMSILFAPRLIVFSPVGIHVYRSFVNVPKMPSE